MSSTKTKDAVSGSTASSKIETASNQKTSTSLGGASTTNTNTSSTAGDGNGTHTTDSGGDKTNTPLQMLRSLGHGAFAHVFAINDKEALKVLDSHTGDEESSCLIEIDIMARVRQPNLMYFKQLRQVAMAQGGKNIGIVMPLCPFTLGNAIYDQSLRLSYAERVRCMFQLAGAVKALHDANYLHLDIKPTNVLLTEDRNVLLSDFGLALRVPENVAVGVLSRKLRVTPEYRAPEHLMKRDASDWFLFTETTDTWSLGIVFLELLTGRPVWPEFSQTPHDFQLNDFILYHFGNEQHCWQLVSHAVLHSAFRSTDTLDVHNAVLLIMSMLVLHPRKRATMGDIVAHPFFRKQGFTDYVRPSLAAGETQTLAVLKKAPSLAGTSASNECRDTTEWMWYNVCLRWLRWPAELIFLATDLFYRVYVLELDTLQGEAHRDRRRRAAFACLWIAMKLIDDYRAPTHHRMCTILQAQPSCSPPLVQPQGQAQAQQLPLPLMDIEFDLIDRVLKGQLLRSNMPIYICRNDGDIKFLCSQLLDISAYFALSGPNHAWRQRLQRRNNHLQQPSGDGGATDSRSFLRGLSLQYIFVNKWMAEVPHHKRTPAY